MNGWIVAGLILGVFVVVRLAQRRGRGRTGDRLPYDSGTSSSHNVLWLDHGQGGRGGAHHGDGDGIGGSSSDSGGDSGGGGSD